MSRKYCGIFSKLWFKIILSGLLIVSLSLPNATFAAAISLTAIVAGIEATSTIVGTTLALSSLAQWASLSDDHPLYSSGTLGPTLSFSATETSFTFDLIQPQQIDFFVDDLPVRLKGIMQGDSGSGRFDAWAFDLTFTYESSINGPFGGTADRLTSDGFFTHLWKPHAGDISPAPGLTANVDLFEDLTTSSPGIITVLGVLDKEAHPSVGHIDMLTTLALSATQNEDDAFDRWQFTAKGVHDVPAPAAIWLVGSGLVGLIGMRKKSSRTA